MDITGKKYILRTFKFRASVKNLILCHILTVEVKEYLQKRNNKRYKDW